MTDVELLIARFAALDVRLTLAGDQLNVSAPKGVLTTEMRAELSGHKESIKAHLRACGESTAVGQHTGIPRVPRLPLMPASHTQQRLWFLQQLDPHNSAYNIPSALMLRGTVEIDALEGALNDLVARHESLRVGFVDADGAPACVVDPDARVALAIFDLAQVTAANRPAEAERLMVEFAARPFDLGRAPLLRAALICLAPQHYVFCFAVHHIIADGLSLAVLGSDLISLYRSRVLGVAADLPVLPVQYLDYAEWERGWLAAGALETQLAFWKQELGGALPIVELPADRPRPRLQTWAGARTFSYLPSGPAEQLKKLAQSERATLFMVLLAALQTLIHRYTGEVDLPIGTAVANRRHPEVERVVGFFANNIVLRGNLTGDPTIRELLGRVRETALRAFSHLDLPFDVLVSELATRRDLEHSPLFQVLFVLTEVGSQQISMPGLTVEPLRLEVSTARFDLSVDVVDTPHGLLTCFEYNTDLFDTATMARMLEHYQRILERFVADPDARVSELQLLGASERERVTVEWNRTAHEFPRDTTVAALFAVHATATPHAVAVQTGSESLTYAELQARVNQLARHLSTVGVQAGALVGICMERSIDMVVAQLALLNLGGAYVPLDPDFPVDRIEFMVRDAELGVIVSESATAARFNFAHARVVCLDWDGPRIAAQDANVLPVITGGNNAAYVIYTSGSTGKPKGVLIEQHSLVNFLLAMHRVPGMGTGDRLLAVTTFSFDIAALEILAPLTCGATLVLADRIAAQDGYALAGLIESSSATILQATPATWRLLLECDWSGAAGLKMLCGGEALPRDLADRLLPLGAELWNMYGPTETTIWSTAQRIMASGETPPIGRPIANTQVYVLDTVGKPVPIGVPGELYIGGEGVARGYLKRPELTAEKFVPDSFSARVGARLYRTGDLARWRADGSLVCLGRVDQQVKVRGYRIEPGEIEASLVTHPAVREAVVVARPDASGTHQLVAYLVARDRTAMNSIDPMELRSFLSRALPDYMVPSVFMALESMARTPNGKIDRRALPEPSDAAPCARPDDERERTGNESEEVIAAIWREVLSVPRVGRHDNFFDLGGHSLLVVRVQKRLQQDLGCLVPIVELFQHTTVASLAARLRSETALNSATFARLRAQPRGALNGEMA